MVFTATGKMYSIAFAAGLFAALSYGCAGIFPVDNQGDLPPSIRTIVNPAPLPRDFVANNRTHRLLVALLDTGIDYNQTCLLNHLHFELNADHQPLRLGWDYIGHDGWPSPYLGRRSVFVDFELELIERLIAEDAGLEMYLDKRRNVAQEHLASVWHGTSIAGLIVQDREDIGLLPYRVVPPNANQTPGHDYTEEIMTNIFNASRQAIEDGAHIIVISGFFHIEASQNPEKFLRLNVIKNRFELLVHRCRKVLFIVSAGNCHGYTFSGREGGCIDFPAGIISENFLVVGALSENTGISAYSNIPTGDIRSVFVSGRHVGLIYPENLLYLSVNQLKSLPSLLDGLREGNESYQSVAANLRLLGASGRSANYGTSFSMGRVANICAELWLNDMDLPPAEIIQKVVAASDTILVED